MSNHTQCKLQKLNGETTFSWIPAKFAKKQSIVMLKDNDGNWDDGWCVMETYASMPSTFIREREQDYKKMRQMTDI